MSDIVERLATDLGGTVEQRGELPDGSGFAVMSMPLPVNHWSKAHGSNRPPMRLRLGTDHPMHAEIARIIREAGRYAYRSATMNGQFTDLDPDALVQNLVVGLLGFHTPDGLSSEDWANPVVIPPTITIDLNDR